MIYLGYNVEIKDQRALCYIQVTGDTFSSVSTNGE